MKYSYEQYAQALFESLQDTKASDHDKIIANFIKILQRNGDLSQYETIIEQYEIYDRKQQGIQLAEVVTASETAVSKDILQSLNKLVNGKVEVKRKVDAGLIGGVVVKVDDTLIDGSIKRQLENLKDTLNN